MSRSAEQLVAKLELRDVDLKRLRLFESLIQRWSSVKNLVSQQALGDLWIRHILDSVQVQRLMPDVRVWADLGSGGGFPGIVTAILLADHPGAIVHLVESDNRKCAFLRTVSRETGIRTVVHHGRIEAVAPTLDGIEAVSARALADMAQLLEWARPILEKGAVGVFPKGRNIQSELTQIGADSRFSISLHPSISQSDGVIALVRSETSMEQIRGDQ